MITGGGGRSPKSLGRLLAYRFADLGCKIVIWDLDQDSINEVVTEIHKRGGIAKGYKCDITNYREVYSVADIVRQEIGEVDVLINNAGIVSGKRILEAREASMEATMKVNAIAHFWTVKAFLPGMMKRNKGHIITIASAAGLVGSPGLVDYTASKFAAVGFHESLLAELAYSQARNIDLTCICPFFIDTGMFHGVKGTFFCPVLNADKVANRIIKAAKRRENIVTIPGWMQSTWLLRFFFDQTTFYKLLLSLGVLKGMDTFQGHSSPTTAQTNLVQTGVASS